MIELQQMVQIYQKPFTREDPEAVARIIEARPRFTHSTFPGSPIARFQYCLVEFDGDETPDEEDAYRVERWVELSPGQEEIKAITVY